MTAINQNLQRIIDDFADRHLNGKNSTAYQNLTAAITASPELAERLNTSADKYKAVFSDGLLSSGRLKKKFLQKKEIS